MTDVQCVMRAFAGGRRDGGFELGNLAGEVLFGNVAFDFSIGAKAEDASRNLVQRSNSLHNKSWSCKERGTGDGIAGTANTWIDNLGDNSDSLSTCGPADAEKL